VMLCGGRAPAEVSSRRPRGMWFGFERDYAPCHSTSQNGVPDSFSGNIYAIRRAMGSSERGEFAGCSAHAFAHRNRGTDIHSGGCDLSPGRVGRFHRQAGPPPSNISRLVDGRHCGTQHNPYCRDVESATDKAAGAILGKVDAERTIRDWADWATASLTNCTSLVASLAAKVADTPAFRS
jgi:hypothetical protein